MTKIFLALGSNQNREHNIRSGLKALEALLGKLEVSSIYESKSVGFDGSDFFNLVVCAHTVLTLGELSCALKKIEDDHGRIRGISKFSPRSLDIDILLFGDCVGSDEGVELPRTEITENAFVLRPLAELAAEEVHPQLGKTYAQLWQEYDQTSQQLWPISFHL